MPRRPLPIGTWGHVARTQAGPGKWVARARFRDFDGITRKVEAWGKSGAAAERALLVALADRSRPATEEISPETTLSNLATHWLAELESSEQVSPQTVAEYRTVVTTIVTPALGGVRVREATVGRMDRFLKAIAKDRPGRARQAKVVLTGMLGLAVRHDVLEHNPVLEVSPLPQSAKSVRALTLEELQGLRRAVRDWQEYRNPETGEVVRLSGPQRAPDLLDVVDLLLATGARIGEILALRWQDVDLSAARPTVTISGTLVRIKGQPLRRQDHPKTASGWRTVTLPRFAVETLLRLQVESRGNAHDVVFPSSTGTIRDPHNLRRQFRAARGEVWAWVTPHTYRKTVATLLDRERGVKEAAAQLGHSGTVVTEAHYIQKIHRAPDVSDVLEVLGGR